jgi:ATP synthase protein I
MNPDDLEDRIAQARARVERHGPASQDGGPDNDDGPGIEGAMSFGLRAVSAVVLGGGLGWAIDRWLGTKPFVMLVLMVLGFGAAIWNVWRSMSQAVDVATEAALAAERSAKAEDRVTDKIDGKSS